MRALLLVLLLAAPAAADSPHREGEYGGVVPGQKPEDKPDAKPGKTKKPPARGTLAWIGFEAKDGGAQVFLQSAGPFEATQRIEGATLVINVNLPKRATNVGRIIDTRFFDNPLASIVAKPAKKKRGTTDVRITFKNPRDVKEAAMRTATEADGLNYVYLSFSEGTPEPAKPGSDDVSQ